LEIELINKVRTDLIVLIMLAPIAIAYPGIFPNIFGRLFAATTILVIVSKIFLYNSSNPELV